ncbi:Ribose-5-phosphate isomerase A protein [Salinisphaera shabanensis E1L3A]|uniref:Ribose-5-phosphate isomerase A n=1 Tax=Salinisphaera shabanensis E1L3A TaxID=1033802 RepID=U2ES59_9GAMM|nr:ribose-5-phosphate isomerase RpiA [Salinisphaera shabanensis]ERJ20827.1 Ribose-5-phosphate isomerase A protein [Salinisphaera shabanensis E1L3A]
MGKQDDLKRAAAEAAYEYVNDGEYLGVGTGSTVNHFIDVLAERKPYIPGCVSSSKASTERLRTAGFDVIDLNSAGELGVYIDGADETNEHLELIKGGGGALTREKIIASASRTFICMVDGSKQVDLLGRFPLPVEVIEMGRSSVARALVKLGGEPELRNGFVSDNGNPILDVYNLEIMNPIELEDTINAIPGVVTVGLFARRPADVLIVAAEGGVQTHKR